MVLSVDIGIVQAIVDGAAAGYAFRTNEQLELLERARAVMEEYEEAALEFSHTVMAELSGCGGSCGPCRHQCALGQELLTAHQRRCIIGKRVASARLERRRARLDGTRLRALRRRESVAWRHGDAVGLCKARRSAKNVAARWYGYWWRMSFGKTAQGRWPTTAEFKLVMDR